MLSDMDMLEEMDARLAAVADVQFAYIQKINGEVEAASGPAELALLAEPLDRCARSIRLTYALRVKLRKDVRALAREEASVAETEAARRVRERDDRLRHRVETLTWREADWENDDELVAEFDRVLEYEDLDPAFRGLPLREQVERLIARLDLKAEPYPGDRGTAEPAFHDTA